MTALRRVLIGTAATLASAPQGRAPPHTSTLHYSDGEQKGRREKAGGEHCLMYERREKRSYCYSDHWECYHSVLGLLILLLYCWVQRQPVVLC